MRVFDVDEAFTLFAVLTSIGIVTLYIIAAIYFIATDDAMQSEGMNAQARFWRLRTGVIKMSIC